VARHKPSPEKPVLIVRAVQKHISSAINVAELWDAGAEFLGFQAESADEAELLKVTNNLKKPIGSEATETFADRTSAQAWFSQFLRVQNTAWLDVHLGRSESLHGWVKDSMRFDDETSVDIEPFSELLGETIEEFSLDGLKSHDLIWKPVRVGGYLAVGYKLRSGLVTYFYFDDDMRCFDFDEVVAGYSWFMDNTGAPISWGGGRSLGVLDRRSDLFAVDVSGDEEPEYEIIELHASASIESEIFSLFSLAQPPSDHILFLEIGLTNAQNLFSEEQWKMLSETAEASKDEVYGWMACEIEEKYVEEVRRIASQASGLYKAMHEFCVDPDFPFRDLILRSWKMLIYEVNGYVWEDLFLHGRDTFGVQNRQE
jgi:hypothetical protein